VQKFSDNFDSNIGAQRFVNMEKLETFKVNDLQTWCKKMWRHDG